MTSFKRNLILLINLYFEFILGLKSYSRNIGNYRMIYFKLDILFICYLLNSVKLWRNYCVIKQLGRFCNSDKIGMVLLWIEITKNTQV